MLNETTSLKLDLGCGKRGTRYEGFTGLDLRLNGVDIAHLDYPAESVDGACCLHVLEHMPRAQAVVVLREIHRVLKLGASLFASTPNLYLMAERYLDDDDEFYSKRYSNSTRRIWNGPTIADRFLDSILGMGKRGHRYAYDERSLYTLGMEAGFAVKDVLGPSPFRTREDHEVLLEFVK